MPRDEIPCAVAAHREAGEVDAVGIDREFLRERIHRAEQELLHGAGILGRGGRRAAPVHLGPLLVLRALRREDEAREFLARLGLRKKRCAVLDLHLVVVATLARAVEEDHERIFFSGLDVCRLEEAVWELRAVGGKFARLEVITARHEDRTEQAEEKEPEFHGRSVGRVSAENQACASACQ